MPQSPAAVWPPPLRRHKSGMAGLDGGGAAAPAAGHISVSSPPLRPGSASPVAHGFPAAVRRSDSDTIALAAAR